MAKLLKELGLKPSGLEDVFLCNTCIETQMAPLAETLLADFHAKLLATPLREWYRNPLQEDYFSQSSVFDLVEGLGILLRARSVTVLAELHSKGTAECYPVGEIGYRLVQSVVEGIREGTLTDASIDTTVCGALGEALIAKVKEHELDTYMWSSVAQQLSVLLGAKLHLPVEVFKGVALWRARAEEYLSRGTWDGDSQQAAQWWGSSKTDSERRESALEEKAVLDDLLSQHSEPISGPGRD